MQHDLPFCKSFDINSILEDMETYPQLKHIRFNKRHNKMLGWDIDKIGFWNNYNIKGNHNYISTLCWSDNSHLTRLSYYKNFVMKNCSDKSLLPSNRTGGHCMENYLNKHRNIENHYGTYVYGTIDESKYIIHIDGRKYLSK